MNTNTLPLFLFDMALFAGFVIAFGFNDGVTFFLAANYIAKRIDELLL